jgi:hypothetical protein
VRGKIVVVVVVVEDAAVAVVMLQANLVETSYQNDTVRDAIADETAAQAAFYTAPLWSFCWVAIAQL